MWRLTLGEISKIFFRPRSYIGFAVSLFISMLVTFGIFLEGSTIVQIALDSLSDSFGFEGKIINGNLSSFILYNSFIIHVPILVSLVAGDTISGEANAGTIRLLLTKPVSRFSFYWSKFLAVNFYTVVLIVFFTSFSYLLGIILMGKGDLIVIRNGINVISENDVLWRFLYATVFTSVSMMVVASLAIMLSTYAKNSLGPIIGTMAILIALNIICTVGFSTLEPILPYLFNVHFVKWQNYFEFEVNFSAQNKSIFLQVAYIMLFSVIGYLNFKRKDVLD